MKYAFALAAILASGSAFAQTVYIPTTEVPWYVVTPQAPGSLAGIYEVGPDPSPNPCGQAFRIIAGRTPGEPECVGAIDVKHSRPGRK